MSQLLDKVREVCITQHKSPNTIDTYTHWINRFVRWLRAEHGRWIYTHAVRSKTIAGRSPLESLPRQRRA